jgi:hypothetical protein|tara:strand:- start:10312 stop:11493 length:1182 start_codon:yes stop_codon:yes gene_type:complete
MINLEYCLIENQYSKDKETIVCITRRGEIELDRSITEDLNYKKAVLVLQKYEFLSLEKLWFECYNSDSLDKEQLAKDLYDIGIDQSEDLKSHLKDMVELTYALEIDSPTNDNGDPEFFAPDQNSYAVDATDENTINFTDVNFTDNNIEKTKPAYKTVRNGLISYKTPKKNETVSFCFYLFLDAKLSGNGEYYFLFKGDFFNETGSETSNFIKPIKLEFKRIEYDEEVYGKIVFESIKTSKEIMEDIDCLFSTKYKFFKEFKSTKGKITKGTMDLDFNILEIKDCIDKNSKIVFETSAMDFQTLCVVSDRVEKEIQTEFSDMMPVVFLQKAVDELCEKINAKRVHAATEEDYEDASKYKEILETVKGKREMIYSYPSKDMPMGDYFEKFKIGKF